MATATSSSFTPETCQGRPRPKQPCGTQASWWQGRARHMWVAGLVRALRATRLSVGQKCRRTASAPRMASSSLRQTELFYQRSGPDVIAAFYWTINSSGTLSVTSLGTITDATFNATTMKGQLLYVATGTWVIVYPSNVTSSGYKARVITTSSVGSSYEPAPRSACRSTVRVIRGRRSMTRRPPSNSG